MPIIDGFEFLESFATMRDQEGLSAAFIVMLMIYLQDRDIKRTRDPSDPRELLSKHLTESAFLDIVTEHSRNR